MRIPILLIEAHPSQHLTRGLFSGGLLRVYGKDLNRLLRVLDPTVITALFLAAASGSGLSLPSKALTIFLLVALILPASKLYRSYRQTSLWCLVRRVSISWALVLTALLLLGFLLKVSANFSRLDMTLWALAGWGLLLVQHVGSRKLLRWHRLRGGKHPHHRFLGHSLPGHRLSPQAPAAPLGWPPPGGLV